MAEYNVFTTLSILANQKTAFMKEMWYHLSSTIGCRGSMTNYNLCMWGLNQSDYIIYIGVEKYMSETQ